MSEINGTDVAAAGAQQAKAAGDHQQRLAKVNVAARQVLGVVVRGMMVSAPGVEPIDTVCATAFQMGALLGDAFEGDLVTILGLRKQIKDAFDKGMNSAKPKQAAPPPPGLVQRLNG